MPDDLRQVGMVVPARHWPLVAPPFRLVSVRGCTACPFLGHRVHARGMPLRAVRLIKDDDITGREGAC